MMVKQVLKELESLADEKIRAHNAKNGAGDNQFGVKRGDIRKVAKKIKTDHKLALKLWNTGNIDARFVAVLIMKPAELSTDELDKLVRSETFEWVADWFSNYVISKHPEKEQLREKWMNSSDPMAARAAWSLTTGRVKKDFEGLDLKAILDRIENEMPDAAPQVQWTMNFALAETGINHPKHRKRAIKIGKKLEMYKELPVPKGCITPYAPVWIEEMVNRQK